MKKQQLNIIQRIGNGIAGLLNKSIQFTKLSNGGFNGMEDFLDTLNLRSYKDSLYLFIGISMIRDTISSIPLEMYQITNKDGDVTEVYDDPILDLIERPNNSQTQKEFWKLSIAYYLLAGEAFWFLDREGNANQAPTAMYNMRPDHVRIVFTVDEKEIAFYEFIQTDGSILKLAPQDVLHIKNVDPIDPVRGVGVIRPASQRIITEKEASKYQSQTFKNQGRPDVAVFSDANPSQEEINEFQDRWEKKFGPQGKSKIAFFGKGTKSMQVINTSPKEMDFINTQNFLRDDILAALRIPKAMLTSDDVNLSNSKVARINYIKEACLPILDTFIDVINNKFLNDMDQDRFITYDNPVNEDREILLKEAVDLKTAGIITIDEARSLMNYDAIDGGDMLQQQMPTLQMSLKRIKIKKLARNVLKKRNILVKKFKAIDAYKNMLEIEKEVKRERNSVFNTPELKELYIKSYNKNIDNKARVFKTTIDVYNKDFLKRIEKYMEDFGVNPQKFFDVTQEIVECKKIFNPLMKSIYSKTGQETMDNISKGFSTKASEGFHTAESMANKIEQRAEFFVGSMLDTDFKEMSKIIIAELADGKGVAEIGRRLRDYFDDMSVARARTIARTETGRLVSQATDDAYTQSAVVTGKEWLTAGDSKVRDEHQQNAGVIVATGASFPNGEHYPGEQTINCRCALAPAV